jgi:hypothetical protein
LIFDAWTKQALLKNGFLRKAEFKDPQGMPRPPWKLFRLAISTNGNVLKINDSDGFKFAFTGGCLKTVLVKSEQGENICELWCENFAANKTGKHLLVTLNVVKAGYFI